MTTKSIHLSAETPTHCCFLAAITAKAMDSNVLECGAISPKNIHLSTETPTPCCFLEARTAKATVFNDASAQSKNKHFHYGLDLSGTTNDETQVVGITSNFNGYTILETPSIGSQRIFTIASSKFLECTKING